MSPRARNLTLNLDAAPQANASFDYFVVGSSYSTPSSSAPNSNSSSSSTSPSGSGDSQAPTISINGNNPATVHVGDTYNDLGAIITDNVDKNLGYSVSVDGTATSTEDTVNINTSVPGTHSIVYTATDQAGNVATATRTVTVVAIAANGSTASSTPDDSDASSTPPTP